MYDFVIITVLCTLHAEMTYLSNRISDYYYISQGKTRIPGVNDGEEFQITDVSATPRVFRNLILCFKYIIYSYAIRHILQANIMRSIGFQKGKNSLLFKTINYI
jgi:hypothetical protein